MADLNEAEQFFYDNGAWTHGMFETSEQGRIRCARESARDEACAKKQDWHYEWQVDPDADNEPGENYFVSGAPQWEVALYDTGSGHLLASLCGIDFGYWPGGGPVVPEDNPPYRRVVEADLASEVLSR